MGVGSKLESIHFSGLSDWHEPFGGVVRFLIPGGGWLAIGGSPVGVVSERFFVSLFY